MKGKRSYALSSKTLSQRTDSAIKEASGFCPEVFLYSLDNWDVFANVISVYSFSRKISTIVVEFLFNHYRPIVQASPVAVRPKADVEFVAVFLKGYTIVVDESVFSHIGHAFDLAYPFHKVFDFHFSYLLGNAPLLCTAAGSNQGGDLYYLVRFCSGAIVVAFQEVKWKTINERLHNMGLSYRDECNLVHL